MKATYTLFRLLCLVAILANQTLIAQTTIFADDFNRASFTSGSTGGTPATSYNFNLGSGNIATTLVSGGNYRVDITTGGGGAAMSKNFFTGSMSVFGSPFNLTLSANNPAIITWTFNMRTNTAVTGIPTQGAMGGGVDLCSDAGANIYGGAPNGYAVIFNSGATGGVSLARFASGMNASVPILTQVTTLNKTNYYSVRVTLNTATNLWSLYVRDDGATGFADPSSGVTTLEGTVTDATYTSQVNANFGFVYTNVTGAGKIMSIDNYKVSMVIPCTGTPTPGTVTASQTASCATSYTSSLGLSGSSTDPGLTYQWQSSPDSSAWSPVTGATNTTYSASVATTVYYRCRVTCPNSGLTSSTPGVKLNVHPLPAAIGGAGGVCVGSVINLTDASPGGAWTSNNGNVTIGSGTGDVTGITPGTSIITYTLPTGCLTTATVTTNPLPLAITGTMNVCVGLTTTLADATGGGNWSSSNGNASIGSASGIVTGVTAGTATITYTLPTGCITTATVTVDPLPSSISGSTAVCESSSIALSNTGGGSWSISNSNATIGTASGIVNGVTAGTSTVTYTLPTGCLTTTNITINALPAAIGGTMAVCEGGSTTLTMSGGGGAWSSSNSNASVGTGSGIVTGVTAGTSTITYTLPTGCLTTATVTVNQLPAAITGMADICEGAAIVLGSATGGGSWSSSNGNISIGTGTGIVTGVSAGSSVVTYTLPTGCLGTAGLTVNPLPAAIGGTLSVCEFGSTTLTMTSGGGGAWASSNANATIGSASGIVAGVAAGTSEVTYTLPTGCLATAILTVNPLPAPVTGATEVCIGSSTTLSNLSSGGSWSSSNGNANITTGTGVVTGMVVGSSEITYTLSTGCYVTAALSINPLPSAITGVAEVCVDGSTTLTTTSGGGTWSSSNGNALIGSATGEVIGITAGTSTITYLQPTGCATTTVVTINALPTPITGTRTVCEGGSTTLIVTSGGGGTWASSNGNSAIGALTGVVTGITAGTSDITYTLPTGCLTTSVVTINPLPSAITGTAFVCEGGSTTTLTGAGGGLWASSNSNASIGSISGIVTGVTAGTVDITYMLPTGCITTATVTVNGLPAVITGGTPFCAGTTSGLSDATAGGDWTSGNPLVATIDLSAGVMTGIAGGNADITYTLPTGCMTTTTVTVNAAPDLASFTTPTASDVCEGGASVISLPATTLGSATYTLTYDLGGANIATGSTVTVTTSAGSASFGTPALAFAGPTAVTITHVTNALGCITAVTDSNMVVLNVNPLPPAISGASFVCAGLATVVTGVGAGTWSSSNIFVAPVDPGTGIVSGVSAGNAIITYTLPTGCLTIMPFTVNPLPAVITGPGVVCEAAAVLLSDGTAGGTWSSSDPAVATVGLTGVVGGIMTGTTVITYTLPTGCLRTKTIIVNPLPLMPDPITGTAVVCAGGATTVLSNATPGGVWSSTNTTYATINSLGVVTGLAASTPGISYTITNSCGSAAAVVPLTVNPLPPVPMSIAGPANVCAGAVITVSNSVPGGVWSNTTPGVATISGTGLVNGLTAGTDTIKYTITNSCGSAMKTKVINVLPLPVAGTISGPSDVCVGSFILLGVSAPGGTWSSTGSHVTLAGGFVTGAAAGTDTIKYSVTNTCGTAVATKVVNVLPTPVVGPITGASKVCVGSGIILYNSATGGAWTSSNALATVAGGAVTGVAPGVDTITYTLPGACGTAVSRVITINALPVAYGLTGGGSYCAGGIGLHVGTNGSVSGDNYQLYRTAVAEGGLVPGTGISLDFGLKTDTGTYTVMALNPVTGCSRMMAGSARITTMVPMLPEVVIYTASTPDVTVGQVLSFTAVVTNGMIPYSYRWLLNGSPLEDDTTDTYTSNSLMLFDNDVLTCIVKSYGPCGEVTGTKSITVNLHNVSVAQAGSETGSVGLYPNPSNGAFTVEGTLASKMSSEVKLEITDLAGRTVYNHSFITPNGEVSERVELDNSIASGVYVLTLRANGEERVFRLVVNR